MAKAKRQVIEDAHDQDDVATKTRSRKKKSDIIVDDDDKPRLYNPYEHIDDIMDGIEKDYGLLSTGLDKNERRVSTGMLVLDILTGRGLSGGGWYTLFGAEQSAKSTTAMTMNTSFLNSNVPILQYWDYEGSTEPNYVENIMQAQGIKVPVEQLFGLRNPETGQWIIKPRVRLYQETVAERFFDAIAKLLRSLPDKVKMGDDYFFIYPNSKEMQSILKGQYDTGYLSRANKLRVPAPNSLPQALVTLDSYVAMLPEDQDDDDPSGAMALQARMFSEQIKRVKGRMRRKMVTVVGMNQLRLRPAKMFGCLHADVNISLVDGRTFTIQDIVEQKIKGEVWSYNVDSGKLEPKAITGWHYNGEVDEPDDWLTIITKAIETQNGINSVTVTLDHEILTQRGWIAAKNLEITDKVVTKYSTTPKQARPFLAAVLCGDSTLVPDSRSPHTSLRLQNSEQPSYHAWKLEKLKQFMEFKPTYRISRSDTGESFNVDCSIPYYELTKLNTKIKPRDPTKLAKHLDLLSLAILYQDDGNFDVTRANRGTITFKRFKNRPEKLKQIASIFRKFGYAVEVDRANGGIRFNSKGFEAFARDISPYVHPSMQYKLPKRYRGRFVDFEFPTSRGVKAESVEIVSITKGSQRKFRKRGKYDITVKDNHNYLAGNKHNGIIVHNSPEYEPGGEALKFFSDCRIRLSAVYVPHGKGPTEEEKSYHGEGVDTYRYIKARAIKNKLGIPNIEGSLRVWITDRDGSARGYCPVWDTYQYLLMTGQVSGNRTKMRFVGVPGLEDCKKAASWQDLKTLVLGSKKEVEQVCKDLAASKPINLRKWCFKQLSEGDGMEKYFNSIKRGVTKIADDA
jgi:recombination protein RecA